MVCCLPQFSLCAHPEPRLVITSPDAPFFRLLAVPRGLGDGRRPKDHLSKPRLSPQESKGNAVVRLTSSAYLLITLTGRPASYPYTPLLYFLERVAFLTFAQFNFVLFAYAFLSHPLLIAPFFIYLPAPCPSLRLGSAPNTVLFIVASVSNPSPALLLSSPCGFISTAHQFSVSRLCRTSRPSMPAMT